MHTTDYPQSQSPSPLSSSSISNKNKILKVNRFQERIRLVYLFLGRQKSFIYPSNFKQVSLNKPTIDIILALEALIQSKQKIKIFHEGPKTHIYFRDPKVRPTYSSLLFPSGHRSRIDQFKAFYSLLESQNPPIYISHFRKIQMHGDVARRLLDVILFVQDQPILAVIRFGRHTIIQLLLPVGVFLS